jgi:hypothetical protein
MKIFYFLIGIIFIIQSCTTDYSCECVINGQKTKRVLKKTTRRQARAACYSYTLKDNSTGNLTKVDCTLGVN